ncbi:MULTISPECIES: VOC family protein [unclassified Treponema]|uniref:VOC family protein n=1 Tax=unclassified Treponema TaxID=2638727 RepID=UPI0020A3F503|nr:MULTISPECIES: VOC family protein [unclassified Treponema]UTC66163.1 VOC family protein [Treponema sp. OMZ 789]UTC68892.1 VOC family protein [Treponema sp. OMZ 790]UTC71620.1 VOC family protein [Treponema sp. OMZ 791]
MNLKPLSQIVFLDVKNMHEAGLFFDEVLGLTKVMDEGWAAVWKISGKAFIGVVERKDKAVQNTGILISITVDNIEEIHSQFSKLSLKDLTPISKVKDIPMSSFFFKGPEDYRFEIQEFDSPKLRSIFE